MKKLKEFFKLLQPDDYIGIVIGVLYIGGLSTFAYFIYKVAKSIFYLLDKLIDKI